MTVRNINILKASEFEIQAALVEWAMYHPICRDYLIHIPNEGKRTRFFGGRLKMLGLRPGVSDLFLAYPVAEHAGLWLEIKSANGKLDKKQAEWLNRMAKQRYMTYVVRGDWKIGQDVILKYLDGYFYDHKLYKEYDSTILL